MKGCVKLLIVLAAVLMAAGTAYASLEFEDTCKESDDSVDTRNDVEILSASYDTASDSIEVCAVLCDDECMPRSQYRFHFDYDMANGMASYLPSRDENSCSISSPIINVTGTTSDDTVRFVCDDGTNYKRVTGPAENCTPVEDGKFCCTVARSSLVHEEGMVEECEVIDIWMDIHNKGIQDRIPDTDDSDGCSKPTGPEEVLVFAVDGTPPEIDCPEEEITIECDEDEPPFDPTIIDLCDADPHIEAISGIELGECEGEATISRRLTATDASGNSSSCDQTILKEDTTAPDIACIGTSVEGTSPEGAVVDVSLLVDAPDNCSTAQIDCDNDSDLFPVGSTEVTCIATDECGNASSCTLTVEVTEPGLTCPCYDEDVLDEAYPIVEQWFNENPTAWVLCVDDVIGFGDFTTYMCDMPQCLNFLVDIEFREEFGGGGCRFQVPDREMISKPISFEQAMECRDTLISHDLWQLCPDE